jgi:phosphoribosylpyrophosphate synthetase
MKTIIVSTDSARHIAEKLAVDYGFPVIFPGKNREGKRRFPDGEIYAKIPEADFLLLGRIVVLHSGAPNPNDGLAELEMILEILRPKGFWGKVFSFLRLRKLEVFFLYIPYGKQDQAFIEGETNAAENLIRKLVKYHKVREIYIVDAHFSGRAWLWKKNWLGKRVYPVVNVSAVDLLKEAASRDYRRLAFQSPDYGGQRRTGIKGTKKKRYDSHTTKIQSDKRFRRFVKGKIIGAIDDLLQTGGTLINFYNECINYGALEVVALLTHGILRKGLKRITERYSKLYLTNTVKRKEANIDITGLVAETLRQRRGR